MDQPLSNRRRVAAAALAATAVLTVTAPSAFADSTPSKAPRTTAEAPTTDGAKGVCKRAPKVAARLERSLGRLNGGVHTVGSVARLQERVDNAKKEGHTAVETYLNDKLTYRRGLVTTLQQRQKDLKDVATWCEANRNGTK
ncbi:hypothetical protein A8W25_01830 [Streptomyces sp. ERV7]|uniref:hypothetical protein n=1 Tax=Streptomyces sp. ERV7 TaxID=1322334 RepID=UPI0007F4E680|nr:hypothetical protein [Streptomyces sp. ERV7]OAR27042.1 hypothetical protein A8W25_01830 [Streptomyces sp. ERV7]